MARFWAPLKSFKSPAAAFEGLWTAKPSAAACEGVPPALPWYLPRPHKLFLLGFETAKARFGHPLKASKASKAPQQLSKAFEPQNPPQQLAEASRLLLLCTFWAPLKSFKSPAAAFEGLWTAKPSAAACEGVPPALPWYLPIGPASCLYWASKLLRGTFWAPLKSLKSPAAAFEGLWTAKPSTAACEGVPPAPQAVSIGLRNCYVARFARPLKASKAPQRLSKAFEPQNPPQQLAKVSRLLCHGTSLGPTSCFYWASKLLRGTFCAPLKSPKSPAAPPKKGVGGTQALAHSIMKLSNQLSSVTGRLANSQSYTYTYICIYIYIYSEL